MHPFSKPLAKGSCTTALVLLISNAIAVSPPPEPSVAPMIAVDVRSDADCNRVDDGLEALAREATRRGTVDEMADIVEVEAVFTRQILQSEIDAFIALGGEIDYVFRAVSYGWHGRLPLGQVGRAAGDLGNELVILRAHRELELYLQNATTNTRAREVWSGSSLGIGPNRGNGATRIAILDTGIDGTHADLAGRVAFWKDYTPDGEPAPTDILGHGTQVAGIAVGTGVAQGGESGTGMSLRYSIVDSLAGVPAGRFKPHPVELRPGRSYSVTHGGVWQGGASASTGFVGRAVGSTGSVSLWGPIVTNSSGFGTGPQNVSVPSPHGNMPLIQQNSSLTIGQYAQSVIINNYHTPGDGHPAFSGIAPLNEWVGMKIFTNGGSGSTAYLYPALDELIVLRESLNIRIVNLSIGVGAGPDEITRAKVNTLALNGILPVVAAGNGGPGTSILDPGRARLALTVGATTSTANTVSFYSQPGQETGVEESMDFKPDILAPGGSPYDSFLLSSDSNNSDSLDSSIADLVANDLRLNFGTSVATPVVSGACALVIESLERQGFAWSFSDSGSALRVKALLTATATETNVGRELAGALPPTLERATTNSVPHPGKDRVEGYGSLNIGAAVQAVEYFLPYATLRNNIRLTNTAMGPRAWAARVTLFEGHSLAASLDVPASADFDLYLYSWEPGTDGNPTILASSTGATLGGNEALEYVSPAAGAAFLVIKAISGSSFGTPATLTIGPGPGGTQSFDSFSIH